MAENNPDKLNVKMPIEGNPELANLLPRNNPGLTETLGPLGPTRQRKLSVAASRSKLSEIVEEIKTQFNPAYYARFSQCILISLRLN